MSVDGRPTWIEYPSAVRIRLRRPVVDVTLPDDFVEVPTRDGDVLVSGDAFARLRDSMIGVPYAVDVGPDLRDVPWTRWVTWRISPTSWSASPSRSPGRARTWAAPGRPAG